MYVMPYRRDWEAELVNAMTIPILIVLLVLVIIVATVLVLTMLEIGRIYLRHGRGGGRIARHLWLSLAGLIGIWLLLAGLVALAPGLGIIALYVASWAFLGFVVAIEYLALRAGGEASAAAKM